MALTRAQIRTQVASRSRMNEADAGEKALLNTWIDQAQDDVQNFNAWWFLEYECSITPLASTRIYAFPTTDIEGTTIALAEIDRNSMHVVSGRLDYFWPSQQDRAKPGWMDTSLSGSVGSPKYWTTLREQILFDVAPNASWVAVNTKAWFRGKGILIPFASDGAQSLIPDQWHWVLVEGALWRAMQYQDPTGRAWENLQERFNGRGLRRKSILEQMVEQCSPVDRRPRRVSVPRIFTLPGRRSVNVRN